MAARVLASTKATSIKEYNAATVITGMVMAKVAKSRLKIFPNTATAAANSSQPDITPLYRAAALAPYVHTRVNTGGAMAGLARGIFSSFVSKFNSSHAMVSRFKQAS